MSLLSNASCICRNSIIRDKSDVWPIGIIRVELEDLYARPCPLYLPALPFHSLPPSLPGCRLNLWLFIACSSGSRAELWVSMLRGRRGCCCRVAHHNLPGWLHVGGGGEVLTTSNVRRVLVAHIFKWATEQKCFSSLFVFMHFCVLTHSHSSLLYQSSSLLRCVDVDRRKKVGWS